MNNPELRYPQVDSNPSFAEIEEKILRFWQEKDVFNESLKIRDGAEEFIFYDGPPFANGLPHFGHLLTGFVKDLVARYQTMKGNHVERRFGWDCHGLPAEMATEKDLKVSGRSQITAFGIDKFNDYCRTSVLKYTKEWQDYVQRQARWVDFQNDYKTMDINFMESVMWAFKALYDKGLIYESLRVMPYSWACETPLSNFETKMDNAYREKADKSITVAFTLQSWPDSFPVHITKYKILAWTSTPWTLPSNLALAINLDMEYCLVEIDGTGYILASSALEKYSKELGNNCLLRFKGNVLKNLRYQPLFPYFANHDNSFIVLSGDFVVEGEGTGIVHMAPGFGEDDQKLCEENNIKLVCPVDDSGKFTIEIVDYQGKHVFDAIDDIIIRLKQEGKWIRTEQYIHNYPHCWRTDTPLIYKAVSSWYVEVTKFKDRMVELNQEINWIPHHIKNGLFGKWLESTRDWSISRNRFWGTPIPVWKSDNPKYPRVDVYGSISELERDFGVKITDLHKPYCDLVRPNPDDPTGNSMMRRVPEVFDCWFESGSMPFAQAHYPFENKDKFENKFPADFIVEYAAQTRGWFYTLMVLSTALFDRPPFLNCICHGVILDNMGRKLSKRLNNFTDPLELCGSYGADSLRFFMLSSAVMRGNELYIDKEGIMVKDVLRLAIKPLWNAYNFFTLYANSDGIIAREDFSSPNVLDRYILSKLKIMVDTIDNSLGNYDISVAYSAFSEFIDVLNNWYIRRNRVRFWRSEKDQDKQYAYDTLYTVLINLVRACAPMMPLVCEEIYQGLVSGVQLNLEHSVHLTLFPNLEKVIYEKQLVDDMDKVQQICSSTLSIRNQKNIRIRQPLSKLTVLGVGLDRIEAYSDLIKDEVNVKQVVFSSDIKDLAEYKLKINFPVLGKRLPGKIKDIIVASKNNNWQRSDNGQVSISGEVLTNEECEILLIPICDEASCSLPSNDALVLLDLGITPELYSEGVARDIIRIIQQARKDAELDVAEKIVLQIELNDWTREILPYKDYIEEQTLAELTFNEHINHHVFKKILVNEILDKVIRIGFKVKNG